MNKSTIAALAALALLVSTGGCKSGPSSAERIGRTMGDWKTGVIAKDLDRVMEAYSEKYVSERGDSKQRVREFMQTVFERGMMDNATIGFEQAEAVIDGRQATFGPVKFASDRGSFVMLYVLKKEGRVWRIVGSKREQ